ncbi:unnamed protein product [Meganyctiphanes norvegica]|uniref:WKF domain-containing protein n=1 Tax=Meganyctiphanes norvegica TaxID=48144 RepID=A0AAV2RBT7_MEGNR
MRKDIESKILERAHRVMKPMAPKAVESLPQESCDVPKKNKKKKKDIEKTTANETLLDNKVKNSEKKKKKDKKRSISEQTVKEFKETTNENESHEESFIEEQTPNKKIKPEDAEEASKIIESFKKESIKKKKKKDKSKKKIEQVNPEHGVKRASAAIVYLQKWDTDRINWKFEKLHQVWLLQNCLNVDRFPEDDFPPFLRYIAGMRGKAREEQIKTLNKVLTQNEEWLSIKEQTGKTDLELQEELKRNVTTPRMIERAQQILDILTKE